MEWTISWSKALPPIQYSLLDEEHAHSLKIEWGGGGRFEDPRLSTLTVASLLVLLISIEIREQTKRKVNERE